MEFVEKKEQTSTNEQTTQTEENPTTNTNDGLTIYKYASDKWDQKYISSHLLTTGYEAKLIANKLSFGIYSFNYFTNTFCDELVRDLKKFDGWTKDRHGNYPTNDVLLKDYHPTLFGIYDTCIRNIVIPLVNTIYEGSTFKSDKIKHETFIVRYKPGVQNSLRLHHDSSVFSIILNLSQEGIDFEGGGTYFPQHDKLIKESKGNLVMHPGKMTHWHGVRPITSGERYVIVSFCKDY